MWTVPMDRVELGIITPVVLVTIYFGPSNLSAELKSVEMHHTVLAKGRPGDNMFSVRYTFPSFPLPLGISFFFAHHWFSSIIATWRWRTSLAQSVRQESECFTTQFIVLDYIAWQFAAHLSKVLPSSLIPSSSPSFCLLFLPSTLSTDDVIWLFCAGWQTYWAGTGVSPSAPEVWRGEGAIVKLGIPSKPSASLVVHHSLCMVSLHKSSSLSLLSLRSPLLPLSATSSLFSTISLLFLPSPPLSPLSVRSLVSPLLPPSLSSRPLLSPPLRSFISFLLFSFEMSLTYVRHGQHGGDGTDHPKRKLPKDARRDKEEMRSDEGEMRSDTGGDGKKAEIKKTIKPSHLIS